MTLKGVVKIFFVIFCLTGVFYLALPEYNFPAPPPDAIQSTEPADLESPNRRGYFTNYTRSEVLAWYKRQFDTSGFFNIKVPTPLFNYPPENAQEIIRDQTGSTYLQEFAHPFRESIYINGNETPKDAIRPLYYVGGKFWHQKIIIKHVPSNVFIREALFLVSMSGAALLFKEFTELFSRKKK